MIYPLITVDPELDGAACFGRDPELWFSSSVERADEAVAICAGCPVREMCRAGALDRSEEFGIWGGLTEAERKERVDGYKPCPCGRTRIKRTHHLCILCQQARKRRQDVEGLANRRIQYAKKPRRRAAE